MLQESDLTIWILAGTGLILLERYPMDTITIRSFMHNYLVGNILNIEISPFTRIFNLQGWQDVTTLIMGESSVILIIVLYLLPHCRRKAIPGFYKDILLSKSLVPDGLIWLMIILSRIDWRRKQSVHIVHIPYPVCIMKDTYLVGLLNIILYVLIVIIEDTTMFPRHIFTNMEP